MDERFTVNWLPVFLIGLAALCVLAVVLLYHKRRRDRGTDLMEGHEYELYCADLLKSHGFIEVEVTRESGDYGVDILAEREGVTYAIQCKCYSSPVGIKAIQEVYAGKDYYDRMVGVVMTNQRFTAPAVSFARKLKVLLWDGDYVEAMEEE